MANPANSAQALAQLQNVQKTAQDPNTILSKAQQQLGVNQARDTVTGLRGAINNTTKMLQQVAPSVMGRTGSSLVTSAQASRQIANEQAPIQQTLGNQTTEYNQAGQDLNNLESQATTRAQGIYQGQQDKLSYLQNLYNTMYQKEQDAQALRQAELDRKEQIRQFNAQLRANGGSGGGGGGGIGDVLSALFGGGGSSSKGSANGASYQQRKDKGYNFSIAGRSANALQYARATGTSFRTLLSQMAKAGDKGAKSALSFVGNDGGYDPRKVKTQWQADLYKALTGRGVSLPKAKKTTNQKIGLKSGSGLVSQLTRAFGGF